MKKNLKNKTNKKSNKNKSSKIKLKDSISHNLVFCICLVATVLFLIFPLFLRCCVIRNAVDFYFEPLTYQTYKSSFIEIIGSIIGTALTITTTLYIQKRIDNKKEQVEKIKEENDERRRIVIIFYDLKFAFEDIKTMCNSLKQTGFWREDDNNAGTYKSEQKIKIYIDDSWIRNVGSLHEIFDDNLIKQIYSIYGSICTIKNELNKDNFDEEQKQKVSQLIFNCFDEFDNDKLELKAEYKYVLEQLVIKGNINEDPKI